MRVRLPCTSVFNLQNQLVREFRYFIPSSFPAKMNGKGVKRKKKSFMQKTMKFHKKGLHGKGVRVDDEAFEYFLHVLKIMNQNFESDEEKRDFAHKVFEQLVSHEVEYSCNQVISRIVDNLLPLTSDEVVLTFMEAFDTQVRLTSMDPFASHVLQKLIVTVSERYQTHSKEELDESKNLSKKFYDWLLKVAKFSFNNFEEFIFDNYANHVLRTVICCAVGETQNSLTKTSSNDKKTISDEFGESLKNFIDQLSNWHRFKELPFGDLSSGFLQVLIRSSAIACSKRTKSLIRMLLDSCFDPETKNFVVDEKKMQDFSIPSMFENNSCIRLLEAVITVSPPKLYTEILSRCFSNRLSTLACHASGNFAVQKLIQYCPEKLEFESIFDELASSIDTILSNNRSGVILQLCDACVRHKTKQSVFMQIWMQYLGCNEPKELQILLGPLTIHMKHKSDYNSDEENAVSLHGSLLVQNMLKFNKPIKIVSSLLEMNGSQLTRILCDQKGSHIVDAFFNSEFVGEKSREKLYKVLQNGFASLATSKHGSRVFDILWSAANVKNRTAIASELLEEEAKLNASPYGRPIVYNLSLGTLRRNKEEWVKAQTTTQKAKKLFADLIPSS